MIGFFEVISPFVSILILSSFLGLFIGFVAFFLCVLNKTGGRKRSKYVKVVFLSLAALILGGGLYGASIFSFYDVVSSEKEIIIINIDGKKLAKEEKDRVRFSLSKIYFSKKRTGSKPTTEHIINFKYNDHNRIVIREDSREGGLYWVFYPKFKFYSRVGFIRIDGIEALD